MIICSCNGGINCCSFKKAIADDDIQANLKDPSKTNLQKLCSVYGRACEHSAVAKGDPIPAEQQTFNCNSCRSTVAQMVRESGAPLTIRDLERQLERLVPETATETVGF